MNGENNQHRAKLLTGHKKPGSHFTVRVMCLLVALSLGVIARTCIRTGIPGRTVSARNQPPVPDPDLVISGPAEATALQMPHLPSLQEFARDRAYLEEDDRELFWRAMLVSGRGESLNAGVPKVAFMFLTKGPLPLGPLWEKFFKGYQGKYAIYIHSSPSYNAQDPKGSVFYGRRIPSKPVGWGQASMIDAERRLLANALLDHANERFVLLSESCIPVFDFPTVYSYLINTKVTFVSSFDDPRAVGRGRYSRMMSPAINISDWRKGSQWFSSDRTLASEIVSDAKYYSIFQDHCLRYGNPMCYMDEHYIPTFVNILHPGTNANRTVTWVYWSMDSPHPERFHKGDVNTDLIRKIKCGERCSYNGETTTLCYLFGRKFEADTLRPLMELQSTLFNPNC
ncbi:hypothetical protein MLD38_030127 [Melastoma candidum]|uniref:Uncharacterized protein n=1 Tax=Melastoma candidum TaxID=119954 RepID=A0ACB9MLB5_9MYRT|nr:hypothetical protein MLD38_030127 [Melastoma candidum]